MTYLHYKNYLGKKRKIKIIDGKYFQLKINLICNYFPNVTMLQSLTNEIQVNRIELGHALPKCFEDKNKLMVPFVIHFWKR